MNRIRSAAVAAGLLLLGLGAGSTSLTARQAAGGAPAVAAPGAPSGTPAAGAFVPLRGATLLPGTRASALSTIQGTAMTSANGAMANSLVRLRDARMGRIVGSMASDKAGAFSFSGIDPGSYIVEVVGNDGAVISTSQLVSVNAGEVATAIVRMPFPVPTFAGLLGQTTKMAASEIIVAAAASSGVLTTGPLNVCVSGPC